LQRGCERPDGPESILDNQFEHEPELDGGDGAQRVHCHQLHAVSKRFGHCIHRFSEFLCDGFTALDNLQLYGSGQRFGRNVGAERGGERDDCRRDVRVRLRTGLGSKHDLRHGWNVSQRKRCELQE